MSIGLSPSEEVVKELRRALWDEPRAKNLIELLQLPATRYPEVPAFALYQPGEPPATITWGELWNGAAAQAARLRQSGFAKGDRALLILPTSRSFAECFFGTLLAGGVPTPLAPPPVLTGAKKERYLDSLGVVAKDCHAAVCWAGVPAATALEAGICERCPRLTLLAAEAARRESAPLVPFEPRLESLALLQYTSGSTGSPKGVELGHENIIANMEAIARTFVSAEDSGFCWLPLFHDMGLIGNFLGSLYCRVLVTFMPPQSFGKDPSSWLRGISELRATISVAPNFAFHYCTTRLRAEDLQGVHLGSLKVILNGAEPVDPRAVERFEEQFAPLGLRPGTVRPVYGLAESTLAVTFSDPGGCVVDEVDADLLESKGQALPANGSSRRRRFVCLGRAIVTQQVQVVGPEGDPQPERHIGEVLVRGPSVMRGYHNRPHETAAALRDGWLRTGDLGYLAEGRLYLTGRTKDLIIRHGRNYYPQDIEMLLTGIDGVAPGGAAALSIEDEAETRVVLIVETRVRQLEAREHLQGPIRERCHNAFLFGPDEIVFVPPGAIPRTSSGKVRRQEAKQLFLKGVFADRSR